MVSGLWVTHMFYFGSATCNSLSLPRSSKGGNWKISLEKAPRRLEKGKQTGSRKQCAGMWIWKKRSLEVEKNGHLRKLTQNHQHDRPLFLSWGEHLSGGEGSSEHCISCHVALAWTLWAPTWCTEEGRRSSQCPYQVFMELLLLVKQSHESPWKITNTSRPPGPLCGEERVTKVNFPAYNWHVLTWRHTLWLYFCLFPDFKLETGG